MENEDVKKKESTHALFRKGISDYGDGHNVTHHLGNDDYADGTNLPDDNDVKDNPYLEGKFADGNEEMQEEDLSSDEEKANQENLRN